MSVNGYIEGQGPREIAVMFILVNARKSDFFILHWSQLNNWLVLRISFSRGNKKTHDCNCAATLLQYNHNKCLKLKFETGSYKKFKTDRCYI